MKVDFQNANTTHQSCDVIDVEAMPVGRSIELVYSTMPSERHTDDYSSSRPLLEFVGLGTYSLQRLDKISNRFLQTTIL